MIIVIVLTRRHSNVQWRTSSVAYSWTGFTMLSFVSSVFLWAPSHCQWRSDCSLPGSERVSHRSTSTVWACPSPVLIYQTQSPLPPLLLHPPAWYLPRGAALSVLSCGVDWALWFAPCGKTPTSWDLTELKWSQSPSLRHESEAALQTWSHLSKMASQLLTRCWWFVVLLWHCCTYWKDSFFMGQSDPTRPQSQV